VLPPKRAVSDAEEERVSAFLEQQLRTRKKFPLLAGGAMADQPPLIDCSNLGGPQDELEMAEDGEVRQVWSQHSLSPQTEHVRRRRNKEAHYGQLTHKYLRFTQHTLKYKFSFRLY
jgi:hypothetical protein